MNRIAILIQVLLVCFFFSACATITTGTSQDIHLDTPKAKGANCDLTDSAGNTWNLPATPGVVTVSKGEGPMDIKCAKEGYDDGILSVDESFQGATLGNVILGGAVGIIIDAASGAAQEYPSSIVIWMKPTYWKSAAEQADWEASHQAHLEKLKKLEEENAQDASCYLDIEPC